MTKSKTTFCISRGIIIAAMVIFLPSCAIVSRDTVPQEELHALVKEHLRVFNDDGLKELSDELCDNHIVFLGEIHRVPELIDAANRIVVSMAKQKPVVYADEACYGLSYLWEPASLGKEKLNAKTSLPLCIEQFNSGQANESKILMTAIDVEHTIVTKKSEAAWYLYDLSSRSNSVAAKRDLDSEIRQLTNQKSSKDMNRYLKKLRLRLSCYLDTFSAEDQEEILFFIELLEASNRFYELTSAQGIGDFWQRSLGWDLREKYFIKTTERAYKKAQNRNAILICRVGAGHITEDKKMLGWHFKYEYEPAEDRVVCINMTPLHSKNNAASTLQEEEVSIDSIASILMEDYKYGYIPLHALQENTDKRLDFSRHFYGKKAKYDGILFVKVAHN